jgi:Cys-rich four helix bundle protein (predicted Tat secretion target)
MSQAKSAMSNDERAVSPKAGAKQAAVDRRGAITAGLAAGAALAAMAVGGKARADDHEHHHEHGAASVNQALIDAGLACVGKGEVCADHCIKLLAEGDTAMKDCLRSVSAMLPVCATLTKLAALDAKRLKEYAKVCIDVCSDCEEACKKHADKHAVCKACQESCTKCIEACKKYV